MQGYSLFWACYTNNYTNNYKNDMMLGFKQYCEISHEAKKRMFCKVEYNITWTAIKLTSTNVVCALFY